MGRGPRYRVPWRRRREGKTNYYKRLRLILSGKPRLVVRITNKYVIVQVAEARVEGDRVIATAHSIELSKRYGWKGDPNNTSASYLTGLLAGYRALLKGVKEAVLDIGLRSPRRGSRVFAALKGAVDAGLSVPHSDEILPDEDRIMGRHVEEYATMLRESDPERYKRLFSQYLKRGLKPESLPSHFEEVLSKIKKEHEILLARAGIREQVG
ncbi:MAG: 50S ribosomal protein L18 [Desulfurococcales archaeon]|nr:50S ribosomal protein L18 [Desulfurococcales archaeon]